MFSIFMQHPAKVMRNVPTANTLASKSKIPPMGNTNRGAVRSGRTDSDQVRFGFYGGYGGYGSYQVYTLDLNVDAHYFSGFAPNLTIEKLLKTRTPAGVLVKVMDNQADLKRVWEQLNMPPEETPNVDWLKDVLVLVAQERTRKISAKPKSMTYSRNGDYLSVELPGEKKPGRAPGTAWYLGVFPNGQLTEEEIKKIGTLPSYVRLSRMNRGTRSNYRLT